MESFFFRQLPALLTLVPVSIALYACGDDPSAPLQGGRKSDQAGTLANQQQQSVVPSPSPIASPSPTSSPTPGTTSTVQLSTAQGSTGTYLTDSQGRSLYIFLADGANQSNCSGACAQSWPPLTVPSGQSPGASGAVQGSLIGTIQRSDGTTQVTYGQKPLYHYAGDTAPGQTNGEGLNQFGGLWFLVQPDGSKL